MNMQHVQGEPVPGEQGSRPTPLSVQDEGSSLAPPPQAPQGVLTPTPITPQGFENCLQRQEMSPASGTDVQQRTAVQIQKLEQVSPQIAVHQEQPEPTNFSSSPLQDAAVGLMQTLDINEHHAHSEILKELDKAKCSIARADAMLLLEKKSECELADQVHSGDIRELLRKAERLLHQAEALAQDTKVSRKD